MTHPRRSVSSGAQWESQFSYHRAIAVGDRAWVSGTTASSRGEEPPEQVADEATIAFAIALDALAELGFDRTEVVRTRMYVTDINDAEIVGRVHGSVFEGVNPASTMVGVSALIDPRLRVEVELEAAKESMTK